LAEEVSFIQFIVLRGRIFLWWCMRLLLVFVSFQLFCSLDYEIEEWNQKHLSRPTSLQKVVELCSKEWGAESHILVDQDEIGNQKPEAQLSCYDHLLACMKQKGISRLLQFVIIASLLPRNR